MIAALVVAAGLAVNPVGSFDGSAVRPSAFTSLQEAPDACRDRIELAISIGKPAPRRVTTKPRTASELRTAQGTVHGLAKLSYDLEADIRFESTRIGNTTCVRVRHVAVKAGTAAPEVWLHPEVGRQRGSCRWRVAWNHEMEHVQIHYGYLSRLNQAISQSLPQLLRELPPVELTQTMSVGTAQAILQKRIMMEIDAINKASIAEARMKHARIDTPSEYRRLASKCLK